ncbi:MAG: sulfotransferase [Maritimibacter sp.]
MSVESNLRKAEKLAKRGDFSAAAGIYKEVLAKFPNNLKAKTGLATVAKAAQSPRGTAPVKLTSGAQPGRRAAAGPTPPPQQLHALDAMMNRGDFQRVVAEGQRLALLFPKAPALLNKLAQAHVQLKQHEKAIELFDRVSAIEPGFVGAYANKAGQLIEIGRNAEAEDAARQALKIDPNFGLGYFFLGYARLQQDDAEQAIATFKKAIKLMPGSVDALIAAGNAHGAIGEHDEASKYFWKAYAIEPNRLEIISNITTALVADTRPDEAITFLTDELKKHPGSNELRLSLAKAQSEHNLVGESIETCRTVLESAPQNAEAWRLLGNGYYVMGDVKNAVDCINRALEIDPVHIGALALRWKLEPLPVDHPDLERLKGYFDAPTTTDTERTDIGMILFEAYDKVGDTATAFSYLDKANQALRAAEPYDIESIANLFDEIKEQMLARPAPVSSEIIDQLPAPHRPIFIVGMPRSGTSLVEQILASHSQVYGAGELTTFGVAMARVGFKKSTLGSHPDQKTLAKLRESYLDGLKRLNVSEPVITDKTPLNFRWVGHILLALPEARVLFMRRDSRATCWSNYSNSFKGRANNFGCDMVDTTRMYRYHLDMMEFWAELFPEQVTIVPYEKLTENQEEESRKLVAAAGLDWEDACLDFHKTKRAVKTISATQVKQKMYTGSSEAWRRYEQYLGPMLEGLEGLD